MKSFASLLVLACMAVVPMSQVAAQEKPAAPAAVAHAQPQKAEKPDLVKGEAHFAAVCAACHGPDANSLIPVNPTLAQQHPEYLVKQLTEFKSGVRANPIMMGMASTLATPEDVRNVAYFAASKAAKPGAAKDKALVAVGERIFRGGVADRQIPACAGCHSPNGAGIPAQFPRLKGQQTDYTVAQLTAFRDGVRNNSLQMSQVAAKLNDREIKALADYISGLQ
jgi:cytochrome c553